ncbi:Hypothetical_protein [Hexamita inflata]|uniref:Hypothetical_protein n=1 Tax=Hexamita inflata TaxID=28002 RepID=A0ABP1GX01_9EUKA
MFKYRVTYDKIAVKYNDGEKQYTEKSLRLESTAYKEIQICGYNNDLGVKEYFRMPNVYNINRLFLDQCIVDLSALKGNFGTVCVDKCSIKGSLSFNLFADQFKIFFRGVLDINLSQLINGQIKKIDLNLYDINQELDLSGANKMYGRLGYLYFSSTSTLNLAKLEGYWDCVVISNCMFANSIKQNLFGAKMLQLFQTKWDIFQHISNGSIEVLELLYKSNFDFTILLQCTFAKAFSLNLSHLQIDLNQIHGIFRSLVFSHCSFQGSLSQNCTAEKLYVNGCKISSQQLSQFSCSFLELRIYETNSISELPQQLQKLNAHGVTLNIRNHKQYLRLTEIELEDSYINSLSIVNAPNIKLLKLIDGCKSSQSIQNLMNIIKRRENNNTTLVKLKKQLNLAIINTYSHQRKLDALKTEFNELIELDIGEITNGNE